MSRVLQAPDWPRPAGYSHGMVAEGRIVVVGGQVGWDAQGRFAQGLAAQVGQALANIVAVVGEAGGTATSLVRLTWFVLDVDEYSRELPAIGRAYRAVLGKHFPAMSVIGVSRLVEPEALVEIEATAVVA